MENYGLLESKETSFLTRPIIEGKKNRKKKRRKRKKRLKRELGAAKERLVQDRYREAAAYIDSQELTSEAVLLGPRYQYSDHIKNPKDMGMSGRGDMKVTEKDVNGLFAYVDLLIKGKSKAARRKEILGPQGFAPTGATCNMHTAADKEETVQRYIYTNFKPTGNIPVDGGDGIVKDARGIIPGLMENVAKINPLDMFESIIDIQPRCMLLTMPVTDSNGRVRSQTRPVSVTDIRQMDPCSFKYYGNQNFVTKRRCEGFQNLNMDSTTIEVDDDLDLGLLYLSTLSFVGLYVMLKIMTPQLKNLE